MSGVAGGLKGPGIRADWVPVCARPTTHQSGKAARPQRDPHRPTRAEQRIQLAPLSHREAPEASEAPALDEAPEADEAPGASRVAPDTSRSDQISPPPCNSTAPIAHAPPSGVCNSTPTGSAPIANPSPSPPTGNPANSSAVACAPAA